LLCGYGKIITATEVIRQVSCLFCGKMHM